MKRVLTLSLIVALLLSAFIIIGCTSLEVAVVIWTAGALIEMLDGGSSSDTGTEVDNPDPPSSACDCSKSANSISVGIRGGRI